MISVSGKKWEQKKINQNLVDKLKQDYNFSDILSRLIISRKFGVEEITTINTDLDLNNVFLNNEDFNQSIKLVVDCINNNEKICILGDYDVDGSAATSLFIKFSNSFRVLKKYSLPSFSPGRGPLVVAETENLKLGSQSSNILERVDLPAPDGEDNIINKPRRVFTIFFPKL